MTAKLLIPRQQANRDIDEILPCYLDEGSPQARLGFIDALEQAFAQLACFPASGSVHHAHELNLPGLRFWPLKDYPHLVFYLEKPDHIDIWRVLHGRRDIPAWLLEDNHA